MDVDERIIASCSFEGGTYVFAYNAVHNDGRELQSKAKGKEESTETPESELALLTDDDRPKFTFALEIEPNPRSKGLGKEFMVAQSMCVQPASADEPPAGHL